MTKGTIFPDWWVQCGRCEHMELLAAHTKSVANRTAKVRGWKTTRIYGMVCSECVADLYPGKQEVDPDASVMYPRKEDASWNDPEFKQLVRIRDKQEEESE